MHHLSIDCIVRRARLRFVGRVVRHAADGVIAMKTLQELVLQHSDLLLPDPCLSSLEWLHFIKQWPLAWSQYVYQSSFLHEFMC